MSWFSDRSLCRALLLCMVGGAAVACASEQPGARSSTRTRSDASDRDAAADQDAPARTRDDDGNGNGEAAPPSDDDAASTCASIREEAAPTASPVDVVWVIDTSGSMADERAQVQANLASFMREFAQSSADTRAVVVTEIDPAFGSPLATDPRYRFVRSGVGSRELYEVALKTFPSYRDFLRKDAVTHFVMVTDDNDRTSADSFRAQMEQQLGHPFVQHAIASESVAGKPCRSTSCGLLLCGGAAAVGAAYNTLAAQTQGEQISICSADWTEVFARLRDAVIASALPCSFAIPQVSGLTIDPALVAAVYSTPEGDERELPRADDLNACGDALAWHYDDGAHPTRIVLCAAACQQARKGGSIDIELGCEPALVQ